MPKILLSVFIIARNEADRIGTAIESVREWADEIVVIDSGSVDDTVKISQSLGAHTAYNAWRGYGPQKRFGEDQCRHRWLLNIDADEEITPALAAEIQSLFRSREPACAAYIIPVRDLLPGETKLARFAHTNSVVRLYNRDKARFSDSAVHDSVVVKEGRVGTLKSPALHRSFRSLSHAIEKMNSYTTAQAENMKGKTILFPTLRLIFELKAGFFKAYFLRGYMWRGRRGFIYAVVYAYGRFLRMAKYIEKVVTGH